jgi:hypothetical protein
MFLSEKLRSFLCVNTAISYTIDWTAPHLAALSKDQALQGQMSSQEGCALLETNCECLSNIYLK